MAICWATPGFKGGTFKLCVLTRWDFNFCVRSSPLRGEEEEEEEEEAVYTAEPVNVWCTCFHRRSWPLSQFVDCNEDPLPNLPFDLGCLGDLASCIFSRMVLWPCPPPFFCLFVCLFSLSVIDVNCLRTSQCKARNCVTLSEIASLFPRER